MIKNIAVILRGHIRTWDLVHPSVFQFYDSFNCNVDYFVSTWNTPNLKIDKIINAFEKYNKTNNLKKVLKVDLDKDNYETFHGPALLSSKILPFLMEEHNKTPYDMLVDTRPDIIYSRNEKSISSVFPEKNTLYTTSLTNLYNVKTEKFNVGIHDWFLVSTPEVFKKLCNRINIQTKDLTDNHHDFVKCCINNNVKISSTLDWVNVLIIRPTNNVIFPPHPDLISDANLSPNWTNLTTDEKIKILIEQDIEIYDYVTQNKFIAVHSDIDELFNIN